MKERKNPDIEELLRYNGTPQKPNRPPPMPMPIPPESYGGVPPFTLPSLRKDPWFYFPILLFILMFGAIAAQAWR